MLKSRIKNRKISMARRVIILLTRNYTKEASATISKAMVLSLVNKVSIDLLNADKEIMINIVKLRMRSIQLFNPDPGVSYLPPK